MKRYKQVMSDGFTHIVEAETPSSASRKIAEREAARQAALREQRLARERLARERAGGAQ